jgi:hypothetical protein
VIEWWHSLGPAQASVQCGGNRHRLRWENGVLHALDHGDVESERALAALGEQSCTCLDLLEAWDHHCDDLRVLVVGSRGPIDILSERDDTGAHLGVTHPGATRASFAGSGRAVASVHGVAHGLSRPPGRTSQKARAESELLALLGLGGGLPDRLLATVAAAWQGRMRASRRPPARSRAQLHAALHGRVCAVMRGWLGASASKSQLTMIGEKGTPKLVSEDGGVRVELPFGWLVDVWAPGLATVWGRFCLSASSDDGRTWQLTTVAADLGSPSIVTLQLGS